MRRNTAAAIASRIRSDARRPCDASTMKHVLLLLILIALFGCNKKSASGKVASCNMEAVHSCREYRDANLALGVESLEKLCTGVVSSAKFSEAACPTARVIATCTKPEGKDFFYEGYESPQQIEESCKQMGGAFSK